MIARTALAALALSCALAAPASAGVVPGLPVDGPSADLVPAAGIDVALAPDGDGAVAYVKKDGGVDHVFVALVRDGALQPPVRVDTGLASASQRPVVAAGNGGRVLVAFLNGAGPAYTARSVELVPGAAAFTAPALIVGDPAVSANTLDLAMEPAGVAYATYTTLNDVRASRYASGAWTPVGAAFPMPGGVLDKVASEEAGTTGLMGEPRVAVAPDGAAYVVFGEEDGAMKRHVYVQRLAGTGAPSGALEVSVSAFGAFPRENFADMVDVDVDAAGTAWIAWRQTFMSTGNRPRALGAALRRRRPGRHVRHRRPERRSHRGRGVSAHRRGRGGCGARRLDAAADLRHLRLGAVGRALARRGADRLAREHGALVPRHGARRDRRRRVGLAQHAGRVSAGDPRPGLQRRPVRPRGAALGSRPSARRPVRPSRPPRTTPVTS